MTHPPYQIARSKVTLRCALIKMSMESRKLVEFYIDTDSESESRSSSEGERPEDEDDGDVVKLDEEESPVERSSSIPMLEESDSEMEYEEPVHLTSPPQGSSSERPQRR